MYIRRPTRAFRKSLKKIVSSGNKGLDVEIEKVIEILTQGGKLEKKNKDHSLNGDLCDYRECHIKSDLLLIYRIKDDSLVLANIGSHSQLFG